MFDSGGISLYHIVHIDRLKSIMECGFLYSDAICRSVGISGTTIGNEKIKARRLRMPLCSYQDLMVGECVPFYFCPRSVMLYVISRTNHSEVSYRGGQENIVHLVCNLQEVCQWTEENHLRYAFTTSNASSSYFQDFSSLNDLDKINWDAVSQWYWTDCKDEKQAEFLVEKTIPWNLIREIGVYSEKQAVLLRNLVTERTPVVKVHKEWYY